MKPTYKIELERDGERIEVELRLTVGGQLALKKKYNENAMSTILEASDDIEKCVSVFNEALKFKDNHNQIQSGEELYDLLVDNGYKDYNDFSDLLLSIGVESGLITQDKKDKLFNTVLGNYDKAFDEIFEVSDEEKNV